MYNVVLFSSNVQYILLFFVNVQCAMHIISAWFQINVHLVFTILSKSDNKNINIFQMMNDTLS